mmetsp:Transcript_72991/g.191333  ORF Transcript_72991/g.191333 Transcript_72991/m.191333 type:complete len:223 (+) Transcript_72991:467-1135(+)
MRGETRGSEVPLPRRQLPRRRGQVPRTVPRRRARRRAQGRVRHPRRRAVHAPRRLVVLPGPEGRRLQPVPDGRRLPPLPGRRHRRQHAPGGRRRARRGGRAGDRRVHETRRDLDVDVDKHHDDAHDHDHHAGSLLALLLLRHDAQWHGAVPDPEPAVAGCQHLRLRPMVRVQQRAYLAQPRTAQHQRGQTRPRLPPPDARGRGADRNVAQHGKLCQGVGRRH